MVLDEMRESKKYGYLDEVYSALLPHFQRHQFALFDFTDPRDLGGADVDGIHAGEGFPYSDVEGNYSKRPHRKRV